MQKGKVACEKVEDCILARMLHAADTPAAGIIPVDALPTLLLGLKKNFTDLQCHLGTTLSVPTLDDTPVGILCIGGKDKSCIRLILTKDEVAGLQKVLAQMSAAIDSWSGKVC